MSSQVGYLRHNRVYCEDCAPSKEIPIFHINIYPYKQKCVKCGKLLVEGQTEAWPELYSTEESNEVS